MFYYFLAMGDIFQGGRGSGWYLGVAEINGACTREILVFVVVLVVLLSLMRHYKPRFRFQTGVAAGE